MFIHFRWAVRACKLLDKSIFRQFLAKHIPHERGLSVDVAHEYTQIYAYIYDVSVSFWHNKRPPSSPVD